MYASFSSYPASGKVPPTAFLQNLLIQLEEVGQDVVQQVGGCRRPGLGVGSKSNFGCDFNSNDDT